MSHVVWWRRAGLALAVVVGVVATPATPVAARPAAACPSGSDGITVVVDFGELSGGVQIRCVTQPVTSGFDALVKAGFTYEGTKRFPGLLCRIDGKPTPAQTPCDVAPPPDRYWAYWSAPAPGGAWTYNDLGAGNRTPPPGSVEGWAWSDGCTRKPQGAPCRAPAPTTTRPAPTTTARAPGAGATDGGAGAAIGPGTTTRSDAGASTSSTAAGDVTTSTTSATSSTFDETAGTAPAAGASGDPEEAAPPVDDGGAGSPAGALAAVGAMGAVAAGGAWMARRRAGDRSSS